ncbi:MAG: hypothetical protein GX589_11305 [Deltaproteobacteria bacterium]|nr:hypothetical protein [Deltaproteobacteria bacterium]
MDCKGVPFGTSVVDECGVCGGSGPGLCGCGDDYSCLSCKYLLKEISPQTLAGQKNTASQEELSKALKTSPSCLTKFLQSCLQREKYSFEESQTTDFCIRQHLAKRPAKDSRTAVPPSPDRFSNNKTTEYFMDEECRPLSTVDRKALCAPPQIEWLATPISLIWDKSTSLTTQATLTQFPLDPTQPGKWYIWRGSALFPLLVYNPKNQFKIKEASQLFGRWTFMTSDKTQHPQQPPWENGFEALASLDKNADGKLSGEELKPLALWFDDNQDGISQPGEVWSLEETGITALYTKVTRRDPKTGDLYAEPGYDRVIGSQTKHGVTVDWFSSAYDTKHDAVTSLHGKSADSDPAKQPADSAKSYDASPATRPDIFAESSTPNSAASDKYQKALAGAWLWSADHNPGPDSHWGLLTIEPSSENLAGFSYVEVPFRSNQDRVRSYIMVFPLKGTITPTSGTNLSLQFEAEANGKIVASSHAMVWKGSSLMSGHSTAYVEGAEIKYSWSAYRIKP